MLLPATAAIQLLCLSLMAQTPVSTVTMSRPLTDHNPFSGAIEVLHHQFSEQEDRDYDGMPDDWSRRIGPGFPQYVEVGIDGTSGYHGEGSEETSSLRMTADGGRATLYSKPMLLGPNHSYVLRARIRTDRLVHDAAMVTVWFLNHQRTPVQRFETQSVTGSQHDWAAVEIESMVPHPDVEFVVIGCHLVTGDKADIGGAAWFDDIWMGKLPHMTVVSNHDRNFVERHSEIVVRSNVMGLDPRREYSLHLELLDHNNEIIQQEDRQVHSPTDGPAGTANSEQVEESTNLPPEIWTLPPQDYGYYQVLSQLKRDGIVILEKRASFAVLDLVHQVNKTGEFGWSIRQLVEGMTAEQMIDVTNEAGINWIKYPLWGSVRSHNSSESIHVLKMLDGWKLNGVVPVGILGDPPAELRKQFAQDWVGVSEIFTMSPSFWRPWLEPVIARYSSRVRYWQLGSDFDSSFVGLNSLSETISLVKREFDLIGRDTRVGLCWNWEQPLPNNGQLTQSFLTLQPSDSLTNREMQSKLQQSRLSGLPRWVSIKPLARSEHDPETRGEDLVKKMVAAKIGEADAIFTYDVFDAEFGLLNSNGSPTLLFLPWRTTALALQGAEFLGSFQMPGNSKNYAFARDDEVVLIVWNDEATTDAPVQEELYLGERVTATNLWGQQRPIPVDEATGRHIVKIGSTPLVIRGCSKPVAQWRLATRIDDPRLASQQGGQLRHVVGKNTFTQGASVRMSLDVPQEWKLDQRWWNVSLRRDGPLEIPMMVSLPPNVTLGQENAWINFEVQADQLYRFRVYRTFEVGLGDVNIEVTEEKLADGRLKVTQIITNHTSPVEELSFRCFLNVPGRRRTQSLVHHLGEGFDRKIYYVDDADAIKGEQLWLRATEIQGKRNLNYRWTAGQFVDK